jgi:hypothetical protein
MIGTKLTAAQIRRAFDRLNDELAQVGVVGELHVVGGAVMCLALGARDSTADVGALIRPTGAVRVAAARVAEAEGFPDGWLNDAVKGFLTPTAEFDPFLELSNLRVFTARPAYLLALKCVAMRMGEEFRDVEDVRFLLRLLDITTAEEAMRIVTQYIDASRIPLKTHLALEEMLGGARD